MKETFKKIIEKFHRDDIILLEIEETIKTMRKINYRNTLFLSIIIISLIPIIVLGITSYKIYRESLSEGITAQSEQTVYQAKNNLDTLLYNIRRYYLDVINEQEIAWLMDTDITYSNISTLNKTTSRLAGPSYYLNHISAYTFINFDTEWVISNRGMYKYEEVKNKDQVEEIYNLYYTSLTHTYWVDNTHIAESDLSREEVKNSGLNLVIRAPLIKKNPHCLLIVNISDLQLEKVIMDSLGYGDITIMNRDGNMVLSTNKSIGEYLQDNKLENEDMNTIKLDDGSDYNLVAVDSDVVNWTYLVTYDKSDINAGSEFIIRITILLLIILVIAIPISAVIVKKMYTPVSQLLNQVTRLDIYKNNEPGKFNNENEFEYISSGIEGLIDKHNSLEKLVTNQLPRLQELFLIRLIRGDIRSEEISLYIESLEIKQKSFYNIIVGTLRSYSEVETYELYDKAKQDALGIAIAEQMPGQIKEKLLFPPMSYEKTIVLILTEDNQKTLESETIEVSKMVNEFVNKTFDLHFSAGISLMYNDLYELKNSYNEGVEAMKSNEFMEIDEDDPENISILFYSDIKKKNYTYSYDHVLEREIKEAINDNDINLAFKIVDQFIDSLIENNVIHREYYFYLHRFAISTTIIATDAGISLNDIFEDKLGSNIFDELDQIYDIEKLRCFLKHNLVEPILSKVNESRTRKSVDTMKDIERLVKEAKGNITLAECAEALNYHPSYIWKVIKSTMNTTFTDYVGNYKLETAKEYLLETDMTIAEIADKLNYTNSQNFIRFFRKLEGVTPGKYRTINKGK